MKGTPVRLTARQAATVLGALRALQGRMPLDPDAMILEILTDGGKFKPLSPAEIDTLCDRINRDAP